LLPKLL